SPRGPRAGPTGGRGRTCIPIRGGPRPTRRCCCTPSRARSRRGAARRSSAAGRTSARSPRAIWPPTSGLERVRCAGRPSVAAVEVAAMEEVRQALVDLELVVQLEVVLHHLGGDVADGVRVIGERDDGELRVVL